MLADVSCKYTIAMHHFTCVFLWITYRLLVDVEWHLHSHVSDYYTSIELFVLFFMQFPSIRCPCIFIFDSVVLIWLDCLWSFFFWSFLRWCAFEIYSFVFFCKLSIEKKKHLWSIKHFFFNSRILFQFNYITCLNWTRYVELFANLSRPFCKKKKKIDSKITSQQ